MVLIKKYFLLLKTILLTNSKEQQRYLPALVNTKELLQEYLKAAFWDLYFSIFL